MTELRYRIRITSPGSQPVYLALRNARRGFYTTGDPRRAYIASRATIEATLSNVRSITNGRGQTAEIEEAP